MSRVVLWHVGDAEVFPGRPRSLTLCASLRDAMRRADWGRSRPGDRLWCVVLAPEGYDELVRAAVPEQFDAAQFDSQGAWRLAKRFATVLATHDDQGLTFALRRPALALLTERWLVEIEDWTEWMTEHRQVPPDQVDFPSSGLALRSVSVGVS